MNKSIISYSAIEQAFKRAGEYVVQWLWWGPHLLGDCWWSLDWFTRITFSLAAGYGYGMLTLAAWGHVVAMCVVLVLWTVGLLTLAIYRGWQAHVLLWQEPEYTPPVRTFSDGQRVKIVREDDQYCGGYGRIVGHVNSHPHPWQVMPDGWDTTLGAVLYADDELEQVPPIEDESPKIISGLLGYDEQDRRTIVVVYDDPEYSTKRLVEGEPDFLPIAREIAKTDIVLRQWLAGQEVKG